MRKVKAKSFNNYIDNFCRENKTFVIESKRNLESLYMNNKLVLMTKNKNNRFGKDKTKLKSIINLFAQVQKSINRYLKQIEFDIQPVEKRFGSSKTDRDKWRSMGVGEVFYYIDVKHCFWRIGFLKGYIGKNLYENILLKEELKLQRNMSLALIIAPKRRRYFKYGKLLHEISEDRRMYRIVYDNIRFTAYNLMGDCMVMSKQHFIAYRTDGIMVDKKAIKRVSRFIDDNGFNYLIKECCKVGDRHYVVDDEEKKLF